MIRIRLRYRSILVAKGRWGSDIVGVDAWDSEVVVFLGKGDGSFTHKISDSIGGSLQDIALGDFNGDGVSDIVVAGTLYDKLFVLIGRGDGTFSSSASYVSDDLPFSVAVGDLNGDGALDMVSAEQGSNSVGVFLGRGDGTFSAQVTYSAGLGAHSVALGDMNGDGVLDVVTGDYDTNTASVLLGKGDGTFATARSYTTGDYPCAIALGDLNGDGVFDLVTANYYLVNPTVSVLLGSTREGVAPLLPFSLSTAADARQALAPLDRKLEQLAAQRGIIGAFQSRVGSAVSTLQNSSEEYAAAAARIRDADVATDAAELTRLQIARQSAAAVLAQANQQPALTLSLLSMK